MATLDIKQIASGFIDQFRGLDGSAPWSWPLIPRLIVLTLVYCLTLVALWFYPLSDLSNALDKSIENEVALQADFKDRLAKAANLNLLKKQRDEVATTVEDLEKQLPNRTEMSALLLSISQMGLNRNLQAELFQPGPSVFKSYYAIIPVAYKATGRFTDFAKFASDVAQLPRIVNLSNITIAPKGEGTLAFEATIKTYRYLDPAEAAAQVSSAKGSK